MNRNVFLALVLAAIATPVFAADYQTNLGPMPLDDETKLVIGGRGEATASSDGKARKTIRELAPVQARTTSASCRSVNSVGLPRMSGPGKALSDGSPESSRKRIRASMRSST